MINLCFETDALEIVYFVASTLSIFCNELGIYNRCFGLVLFLICCELEHLSFFRVEESLCKLGV